VRKAGPPPRHIQGFVVRQVTGLRDITHRSVIHDMLSWTCHELMRRRAHVVPASKSPKTRIKELRAKRKPLWERFESHPHEIELAAELKVIDDLIAKYNEQIQRETGMHLVRAA
jgi:hypothetical protein